MFDEKELEKLQNEIGKRDTIRVTHEDGTFEEYTADIWTLVGLDTKEKRMLDECKVCVAGGMGMAADVTVQIAMLRNNADMLLKALLIPCLI